MSEELAHHLVHRGLQYFTSEELGQGFEGRDTKAAVNSAYAQTKLHLSPIYESHMILEVIVPLLVNTERFFLKNRRYVVFLPLQAPASDVLNIVYTLIHEASEKRGYLV